MAWKETVVKTSRDGVLTLEDAATPTANTFTLALDAGDTSISRKKNVVQIKDRGVFDHFRKGEDEVVTLSFSGFYTGLYGSAETLYAALFQEDQASAWVSTTDGDSDVFTVDLKLTITDVDGSSTEEIKCVNFAVTEFKLDEAMDGNKVTITGICSATDLTITQA